MFVTNRANLCRGFYGLCKNPEQMGGACSRIFASSLSTSCLSARPKVSIKKSIQDGVILFVTREGIVFTKKPPRVEDTIHPASVALGLAIAGGALAYGSMEDGLLDPPEYEEVYANQPQSLEDRKNDYKNILKNNEEDLSAIEKEQENFEKQVIQRRAELKIRKLQCETEVNVNRIYLNQLQEKERLVKEISANLTSLESDIVKASKALKEEENQLKTNGLYTACRIYRGGVGIQIQDLEKRLVKIGKDLQNPVLQIDHDATVCRVLQARAIPLRPEMTKLQNELNGLEKDAKKSVVNQAPVVTGAVGVMMVVGYLLSRL